MGTFLQKRQIYIPHIIPFFMICKRGTQSASFGGALSLYCFFKGPRVTMASSALQGFIRCQPNVPRLYCIYIIPHKPKHNFKLFSFNNIINPILDYQLRLNQIVYLYPQVLLTPNTIHTITFLLNIF